MSELEHKTVLAFMAHPDDAEYLAGGTLLRLSRLGWEVHIATATAGECGTLTETPWQMSAIRTEEARHAAQLLGGNYHCLGAPDGRLVYDVTNLQKTIDLFRNLAPTLVLTHAPSDCHIDHEIANRLGRQASLVYGAPNASAFPIRQGTRIPHLYYCVPHGGVNAFGEPVEPTTRVNITSWIERKKELLACHASQLEWMRKYHGINDFIESMKYDSQQCSLKADSLVESFIQNRSYLFPRNDLLSEILSDSALA